MEKKYLIIVLLILVTVFFSGCLKKENNQEKYMSFKEELNVKKIALVLAHQGFQDFEYQETRKVLEEAGMKIIIVSSLQGEATGKLGLKVVVEELISEVNISETDALIFIGGPGAVEYLEDPIVYQLIEKIINEDKVLGAICIAPAILAKSGFLKGKKATIWASPIDQEPIEILKENQVEYLNQDVVVDGKIITANGPIASLEFGKKIIQVLNGK